jgi:hypothetical protein
MNGTSSSQDDGGAAWPHDPPQEVLVVWLEIGAHRMERDAGALDRLPVNCGRRDHRPVTAPLQLEGQTQERKEVPVRPPRGQDDARCYLIGMACLYFASHASKVSSSGLRLRENSTLRAPQK